MPFAAGLFYHLFQGGEADTPPLVLIHGAGGMHLYWPVEIRRLVGHRVSALDLPGHGRSAECGGLQSVEAYADQVIQWLEAVELPKAVFMGHSLGGEVVLSLAARFPKHVLGISLVSTSVQPVIPTGLLENSMNPTTFYNAVEALVQSSYSISAPPRLAELGAQRLAETRPSVLYGDLLASANFDGVGLLASIHCPTLVLCGVEDRLTPLRASQFLAGAIPGAQLVAIPQAGHMVMLEKPLEVAQALRSFLNQIPYRLDEAI